jgi:hypothetical protein
VVVSLEPLELDGALLDPELELGVLAEPLPEPLLLSLDEELGVLELGVLLEELELGLGVEAEPDIEEDDDGLDGEVLEPDEDDDGLDGELLEPDDDGLEGEVLEDEDPAEDLSPERDAPGPPPVLSQPYRPLTATAMGITTNAVFLSKLIEGSSQ